MMITFYLVIGVFLSYLTLPSWTLLADPTLAYTGFWSQSNFGDRRTAPNIQGVLFTKAWAVLQPEKNRFDWSEFDKDVLDVTERNLAISFRIYTGQHAPRWIYDEGVPEVKLNCTSNNCNDADESDSFPYYPDPTYQDLYLRFITIFREHLETLPASVRNNIIAIQSMYGTTGDLTPWHGVPSDPQFQNCTNNSEEFLDYCKVITTHFCNEYANTNPNIKLILQRSPNKLGAFFNESCPKHWMKQGIVSHGYQLNDELEAEEMYMDYLRSEVDGFFIRSRGENSQDTTEDGWWQQALASNFMAHMAWMLYFGQDFHEVSPPYTDMPLLQPAFEFFNHYTYFFL